MTTTYQPSAEDRLAELEQENASLRMELAVYKAAHADGFAHPETAYKLIDRSRISYDERGKKWSGIEAALGRFRSQYPNLVDLKPAPSGSPPRPEHPGNSPRTKRPNLSGRGDLDPFAAVVGDMAYERM